MLPNDGAAAAAALPPLNGDTIWAAPNDDPDEATTPPNDDAADCWMLLVAGTAPKESGFSVVAVPNDGAFACVVMPLPKANVDDLLWDNTAFGFGSDPNEGVGLLNDEFALPNVGG